MDYFTRYKYNMNVAHYKQFITSGTGSVSFHFDNAKRLTGSSPADKLQASNNFMLAANAACNSGKSSMTLRSRIDDQYNSINSMLQGPAFASSTFVNFNLYDMPWKQSEEGPNKQQAIQHNREIENKKNKITNQLTGSSNSSYEDLKEIEKIDNSAEMKFKMLTDIARNEEFNAFNQFINAENSKEEKKQGTSSPGQTILMFA